MKNEDADFCTQEQLNATYARRMNDVLNTTFQLLKTTDSTY